MGWLKSIAAIVAGYAAMICGTWFAQEVLFPGIEYGAPLLPLMAMGAGTAALGGIGGVITALIAPSRPLVHLLPMSILILAETTALYVQGRVHGPLWFELVAAAALVAGVVAGALGVLALRRRRAVA